MINTKITYSKQRFQPKIVDNYFKGSPFTYNRIIKANYNYFCGQKNEFSLQLFLKTKNKEPNTKIHNFYRVCNRCNGK